MEATFASGGLRIEDSSWAGEAAAAACREPWKDGAWLRSVLMLKEEDDVGLENTAGPAVRPPPSTPRQDLPRESSWGESCGWSTRTVDGCWRAE
jgi:hypothetical protein